MHGALAFVSNLVDGTFFLGACTYITLALSPSVYE